MGAAAGGIGALFGIGGGLVLVPGLTLLGGRPFHAAGGVSLVAV
ncbi:MAG: sulfite exporter TauE/SafE family protein, partial [Gemmatimonadetes bacterium]|nr:sulfite exporter TauE/SafE family protein [Gemmatimonadota bacterium]